MSAGTIKLVGLTKFYDADVAVNGIDLDIPGGEFFSLLGPSGCGKTTTLRLIAGFERPTRGTILLNGTNMEWSPPHKRPVNTVFQNYALFPHLNVFDNVAFGLRVRQAGVSRQEGDRRAREALDLVQLKGFERRKPVELSGGQQQRVALARALVLRPACLLLDEPLGALDAKLRRQLQVELKALQEQVGITFVYVTHDQDEALTMSDRIAVMNHGVVEQVGSPHDIYETPQTAFVADFLGASNLMTATVKERDDDGRMRLDVGGVELVADHGNHSLTGEVKVTIRPERVSLEPSGPKAKPGENRVAGTVDRELYLGSAVNLIVDLVNGMRIEVEIQNAGQDIPFQRGSQVHAHLASDALRVLSIGPGEPGRSATRQENGTGGERSPHAAGGTSP